MTLAEAQAVLARKCPPAHSPTLTEGDLDEILGECRTADAQGRLPDDDGWSGAYDLNLAAQKAWEMKMASAAHCVDFSSDGERWDRSQVIANCERMVKVYKAKRGGSVPSGGRDTIRNGLYAFQIVNGPQTEDGD